MVRPAIPGWNLLLEPHVTDEHSGGTGLSASVAVSSPLIRSWLPRSGCRASSAKARIELDAQPVPAEPLGHHARPSPIR